MNLSRTSLTLVLSLFSGVANADVVQVSASKDNTLYETADGASSNATGQYFFVGRTFSGQFRRSVIAFDVAGAIPAGSSVTAASLSLHMSKTTNGAQPVSLHRALVDWGESTSQASGQEGGGAATAVGDATWIHSFAPSTFWNSSGGDFAAASSAQTSVSGVGTYEWTGLASDVQAWLDDPGGNFGWFVVGNESFAMTSKRFDTRENVIAGFRPVLTVEFDPPGGFPFFCHGDGGDQAGCTDCPCGNNSVAGTIGGCVNQAGRSAVLIPSGAPSVSADTLRFELRNANASTLAVLVSADQRAPANAANPCFGQDSGIPSLTMNGLRCVVQNVQRHGGRQTDSDGNAGPASPGWGPPDAPPAGLVAQGGFAAGQTRAYQAVYRELPFASCTQGLNTSQGVGVTFLP